MYCLAEVQKDLQQYWSFRGEIAIIYPIAMKGKRMIIPALPQGKALNWLHINHKGIKKTRLLACESTNWINISPDIEDTVKTFHFSYTS